jgi:circadian clock protein KaiB
MSLSIKGDWDDLDLSAPQPERYRLRLYVAGASSNSSRAITNVKSLCEQHLSGNYDLEIIDVNSDPAMAEERQLIALPLLIRIEPAPERRLIGDMSNTVKVLRGLGLTIAD